MAARECAERHRLLADVIRSIERLIEILLDQQRTLKISGASASLLDGDFGAAAGEKERAVGGLCEHEKEHGCAAY